MPRVCFVGCVKLALLREMGIGEISQEESNPT